MSDYKEGTLKSDKANYIIALLQEVWSKKPISLTLYEPGNMPRTILAEFDPEYDTTGRVMTNAGKIAWGNKMGNKSEKRMILNIGSHYYELLEDSDYVTSAEPKKNKKGKLHEGIIQWHYFNNDIYYMEYNGNVMTPAVVEIAVKEKRDGTFVYNYYLSANKKELLSPLLISRGITTGIPLPPTLSVLLMTLYLTTETKATAK